MSISLIIYALVNIHRYIVYINYRPISPYETYMSHMLQPSSVFRIEKVISYYIH